MNIVPFEPTHMKDFRVRPGHWGEEEYVVPPEEVVGEAYTLMRDGKPVFCMGRVPTDRGWHVWTLIGHAADMRTVTRVAARALSLCSDPTETLVRNGYAEGERWATYLGFKKTGPHPEFKGYDIYERSGSGQSLG